MNARRGVGLPTLEGRNARPLEPGSKDPAGLSHPCPCYVQVSARFEGRSLGRTAASSAGLRDGA